MAASVPVACDLADGDSGVGVPACGVVLGLMAYNLRVRVTKFSSLEPLGRNL